MSFFHIEALFQSPRVSKPTFHFRRSFVFNEEKVASRASSDKEQYRRGYRRISHLHTCFITDGLFSGFHLTEQDILNTVTECNTAFKGVFSASKKEDKPNDLMGSTLCSQPRGVESLIYIGSCSNT